MIVESPGRASFGGEVVPRPDPPFRCSRTTSRGAIETNILVPIRIASRSSIRPRAPRASGTRSIGSTKYNAGAASSNFSRRGTRLSISKRKTRLGILVELANNNSIRNTSLKSPLVLIPLYLT